MRTSKRRTACRPRWNRTPFEKLLLLGVNVYLQFHVVVDLALAVADAEVVAVNLEVALEGELVIRRP